MAKRKSSARRSAPRTTPTRVNPFAADGPVRDAEAPPPRGVRPSSFGQSYRPVAQEVDPDEAALYGQVAPGMRGASRGRMPDAATAANTRMTASADMISNAARAAAYREELLLPEEEGDEVERMGIEEFERERDQDEPEEERSERYAETFPATQRFEQQRVHGRSRVPPPPADRPAPRRPVASSQPVMALAHIGDGHVDNLWDWIRQDGDKGATFLGQEFDHAIDLFRFVERLVAAEGDGLAIARAITYGNHHLGFLMLTPILTNERMAILHCYLQPGEVRDRGGELIVFFVDVATKLLPGFKLAVPSPSPEWTKFHTRVLGPLGFAPHTMFVR